MKHSEFLRVLISIKAFLESDSPDLAIEMIDEILDEAKAKTAQAGYGITKSGHYK